MPRGPAPGWRARKEPVVDHWVLASIDRAKGRHDKTGHYADVVIAKIATRDEAREWVRALHRSGRYLTKYTRHQVGIHTDRPVRDGNGWKLTFRAVDKAYARKSVIDRYGPDRTKWPYDPRRRGGAQ